ncbi:hypothetical protein [Promicromonospora aerolata]|uniref:Acetyltransferase (GNAT) family protein n=1 Tax=Promicromonospora aerolata TaxID=195749 RepID=A0ABW4V9S4_9MICO
MIFDPTAVQKFSVRDVPDWFQVGDHQAYVGYIADEDEGSRLGLAYLRFRKGVEFDFLWADRRPGRARVERPGASAPGVGAQPGVDREGLGLT